MVLRSKLPFFLLAFSGMVDGHQPNSKARIYITVEIGFPIKGAWMSQEVRING